jgi:hypothetical protein
MSTTELGAGETITDAPITPAVAHVSESVDEHTPPTPVEPPADAADGLAVITEAVATLATSVEVLTNVVADLGEPDENPVASIPWTHRGGHESRDAAPDSIPWTHRGGSHHDADE